MRFSFACRTFLFGILGLLLASGASGSVRVDPRLRERLARVAPHEPVLVWVFFQDKGGMRSKAALRPELVTARSLQRRLKVRAEDRVVDETDVPVNEGYVQDVASRVVEVRQRSKWFDGVSVLATRAQIARLETLPHVKSIELVARFRRNRAQVDELAPVAPPIAMDRTIRKTVTSLDYGESLTQVQLMNVPALHDRGIHGQGVFIAHFDNGHRLLAHQVFASMNIVATYDFVDHDTNPAPSPSAPDWFGAHGISTLSVLGGYAPGQLIGPAYGANFLLARTEDDASETPLEEDNWIAAMEWADSLGVDVTSTSLGYLDFDQGYQDYFWQMMDGDTARITQAADLAVARGIVVVNAAGNEGFDPAHNTLLAPADGDSVIAVGGVTSTGERSSFSSVGPTTDTPPRIKPDIMALGSSVRIASASGTTVYAFSSGTSFACPLAAGVAAMLLSAHPTATPIQIRDALRSTANHASAPNNEVGWGIVNAVAALDWLQTTDIASPNAPAFRLEPNFPNPFNPTTTISYALPEPSLVTLRVFDFAGRRVRTLVHTSQPAQHHHVLWNGQDDAGHRVSSGVYLYRLQAIGTSRTPARIYTDQKKMILVK